MTRRITAAILLTVWAILVAGGFTVYWAVRSVLLADLDRSLVDTAGLLPEVSGGRDRSLPPPTAGPEDRYVIKNAIGQRVGSPADKATPSGKESRPPYVAAFAPLGGGRRLRTVTVRLIAGPGAATSEAGPAARLEAGTPVT